MEEKFYLTAEFKALRDKWDHKLAENGFKEIENRKNADEYLTVWHSTHFFRLYSVEEFQEGSDYYNLCWDFYWNYRDFKDDREKEIWRLHTEGFSRRKITQIFKKQRKKITESAIQIILSHLKKIMQGGHWPSSEMRDGFEDIQRKFDQLQNLPPRG